MSVNLLASFERSWQVEALGTPKFSGGNGNKHVSTIQTRMFHFFAGVSEFGLEEDE